MSKKTILYTWNTVFCETIPRLYTFEDGKELKAWGEGGGKRTYTFFMGNFAILWGDPVCYINVLLSDIILENYVGNPKNYAYC